mgnify:CR=1 FL=1
MFTVKHTSPEYVDTVYSAAQVRFDPTNPNAGTPETVWLSGGEEGNLPPITNGVVYVMNDAGSTVAKYDLEAKRRGPIEGGIFASRPIAA